MGIRIGALALGVALATAITGVAEAQTTRIRSVRVAAPEVARTAGFYQAVFDLKVVRTIDRDGALYESILNYGATKEAAAANTAPKLVVILKKADAPEPSVSNLVFGVKDLDAILSKAKASGGTVSRPATTSAATGSRIAFIKDPAGNEIELIEEK